MRMRLVLGLCAMAAACGPMTVPVDGATADSGSADAPPGTDAGVDATAMDTSMDDGAAVDALDAAPPTDVIAEGDGGAPADGATCATTPTFATVQSQVFVGCGGKGGCHTRGPGGDGLILTSATSRAQLVNVPSVNLPSMMRVAPGDVDHSFLWRKLTNDLPADGTQGRPMPISMLALGWHMLPASEMDLVRCWIAGGAN